MSSSLSRNVVRQVEMGIPSASEMAWSKPLSIQNFSFGMVQPSGFMRSTCFWTSLKSAS